MRDKIKLASVFKVNTFSEVNICQYVIFTQLMFPHQNHVKSGSA